MQQRILNEYIKIENWEEINSVEMSNILGISHEETVSCLKSLESRFYFVLK